MNKYFFVFLVLLAYKSRTPIVTVQGMKNDSVNVKKNNPFWNFVRLVNFKNRVLSKIYGWLCVNA